jgi:hypothetical protein
MQVHIGSEADNHVAIRVLGKPESRDAWEFVNAEIDVQAGFWRGTYRASLQATDFPPFRQQLQAIYDWKGNSAAFTTIEGWLTLNLTADRLGHVHLDGTATDYPGTGNTLTFHLDLDQSYLPQIIAELESIEQALA